MYPNGCGVGRFFSAETHPDIDNESVLVSIGPAVSRSAAHCLTVWLCSLVLATCWLIAVGIATHWDLLEQTAFLNA